MLGRHRIDPRSCKGGSCNYRPNRQLQNLNATHLININDPETNPETNPEIDPEVDPAIDPAIDPEITTGPTPEIPPDPETSPTPETPLTPEEIKKMEDDKRKQKICNIIKKVCLVVIAVLVIYLLYELYKKFVMKNVDYNTTIPLNGGYFKKSSSRKYTGGCCGK